MGMHNLVPLTTALTRAGLAADTPAAVVERGFTPDQRSIVGTLATLPDLAARAGASSPSVIVVGEVVRQSAVWARRSGPAVDGSRWTSSRERADRRHRRPLSERVAATRLRRGRPS